MGDLPPKLFFRIGEVAGLVGVEPHVLRYWEREFRSIRPTKSAKGQRVYSRKDVENLLRVRDLLYRDGFTIAGAKKKLQHAPSSEPAALVATNANAKGQSQSAVVGEMNSGASRVVTHEPLAPIAPLIALASRSSLESIVINTINPHDHDVDDDDHDDDDDEEAVTESSPHFPASAFGSANGANGANGALSSTDSQTVREKLALLRSEVESFLLELGPKSSDDAKDS